MQGIARRFYPGAHADMSGYGHVMTHVAQMAFQLAYAIDMGELTATYESSMTRLFRCGQPLATSPRTVCESS